MVASLMRAGAGSCRRRLPECQDGRPLISNERLASHLSSILKWPAIYANSPSRPFSAKPRAPDSHPQLPSIPDRPWLAAPQPRIPHYLCDHPATEYRFLRARRTDISRYHRWWRYLQPSVQALGRGGQSRPGRPGRSGFVNEVVGQVVKGVGGQCCRRRRMSHPCGRGRRASFVRA